MCAFWLEIVSVCVAWGENFLPAPPSADMYDIFTVPAFFDAPIGSMTARLGAQDRAVNRSVRPRRGERVSY